MRSIRMKGRTVEEAVSAALEVLGGKKEDAKINVLSEGKPGMLGVLGGEEAEVEVVLKGSPQEDAKQVLQEILDKMSILAAVEASPSEDGVELKIKGEDMGRIIGKEGSTLRALEILVGSIIWRMYQERIRIGIDAGDYKVKRKKALERLANEAAEEVSKTGMEKVLPHMEAWDRRVIHLCLQNHKRVTTFSRGEGRERRLVIAPS